MRRLPCIPYSANHIGVAGETDLSIRATSAACFAICCVVIAPHSYGYASFFRLAG